MPGTDRLSVIRAARRLLLPALVVVVTLAPLATEAADPFVLRYKVERSESGPVRVRGSVINEGRLDALDVYVTAEALDGGGKVVGRGISFVSQSIPQGASVSFVVSIPAAHAAANFRVHVSSFRFGPGGTQAG
jgi:hypothetical protein